MKAGFDMVNRLNRLAAESDGAADAASTVYADSE